MSTRLPLRIGWKNWNCHSCGILQWYYNSLALNVYFRLNPLCFNMPFFLCNINIITCNMLYISIFYDLLYEVFLSIFSSVDWFKIWLNFYKNWKTFISRSINSFANVKKVRYYHGCLYINMWIKMKKIDSFMNESLHEINSLGFILTKI